MSGFVLKAWNHSIATSPHVNLSTMLPDCCWISWLSSLLLSILFFYLKLTLEVIVLLNRFLKCSIFLVLCCVLFDMSNNHAGAQCAARLFLSSYISCYNLINFYFSILKSRTFLWRNYVESFLYLVLIYKQLALEYYECLGLNAWFCRFVRFFTVMTLCLCFVF